MSKPCRLQLFEQSWGPLKVGASLRLIDEFDNASTYGVMEGRGRGALRAVRIIAKPAALGLLLGEGANMWPHLFSLGTDNPAVAKLIYLYLGLELSMIGQSRFVRKDHARGTMVREINIPRAVYDELRADMPRRRFYNVTFKNCVRQSNEVFNRAEDMTQELEVGPHASAA